MFDDYKDGKVQFKLFGANLSELNSATEKIAEKFSGVTATCLSRYGDSLFTISCENVSTLDLATKAFLKSFSQFIYADSNVDLAEYAVGLLKLGKRKLCVAESFTGGRLAHSIVSVPGASEVFYSGLVCYDTDAKINYLGVSPDTVRLKTVVSREVAFEMVKGLLLAGKCDIALSTTGYASPTGDPTKPTGLCFIGAGEEDRAEVNKYMLKGERTEIIEQGKNAALFMLCKLLRGGVSHIIRR